MPRTKKSQTPCAALRQSPSCPDAQGKKDGATWRVIVVGGHPDLQEHLARRFHGSPVELIFFSVDGKREYARSGDLLISADLVVIMRAFLSHSLQTLVLQEARKLGVRVAYHNSNGVNRAVALLCEQLGLGPVQRPA